MVSSIFNNMSKQFSHLIQQSNLFLSRTQIEALVARHGLTFGQFTQAVAAVVDHIVGAGRELKFPVRTVGTAVLLGQHFYLFNNPLPAVPAEMACACLLVASKMEDTPKKSKDIITAVLGARVAEATQPNRLEESRLQVLGLERHILETMGFDFRQNSAQYYVIKICKDLGLARAVAQVAWAISTDAFYCTVYLTVPAHTAALACIVLAAKLQRDTSLFPLDSTRFHSARYKTNVALLQLLMLYTEPEYAQYARLQLVKHASFNEFSDICYQFRADIDRAVSTFETAHAAKFTEKTTERELALRASKLSDEGTVRYVLD